MHLPFWRFVKPDLTLKLDKTELLIKKTSGSRHVNTALTRYYLRVSCSFKIQLYIYISVRNLGLILDNTL